MIKFEEAAKIIREEIEKLDFIREPEGLYKPIEYVLSIGGKRLRPTMCLMAASIFTREYYKAVPAAIGLEVFHNFTLLHDDIMDDAPLRRNHPTVHVKWNANTAILTGDAMLIMAYQFIQKIQGGLDPEVLDIFSKTALQVCEGQQYDMDFETKNEVSEKEYLRMIELKTAVLIAASLKIGAVIGGAPSRESQMLYEAGKNIGLAFQLQDDLLDVYGEGNVFGKKIGGDIVENKKTYLVIKAKEVLPPSDGKKLDALYQTATYDPELKVKTVVELFNKAKVKMHTTEKIEEYFHEAMKCFESIQISPDMRNELKGFFDSLLNRES